MTLRTALPGLASLLVVWLVVMIVSAPQLFIISPHAVQLTRQILSMLTG